MYLLRAFAHFCPLWSLTCIVYAATGLGDTVGNFEVCIIEIYQFYSTVNDGYITLVDWVFQMYYVHISHIPGFTYRIQMIHKWYIFVHAFSSNHRMLSSYCAVTLNHSVSGWQAVWCYPGRYQCSSVWYCCKWHQKCKPLIIKSFFFN